MKTPAIAAIKNIWFFLEKGRKVIFGLFFIKDVHMTPVILFPHTQLVPPALDKALARFGNLTVFVPWFMEEPVMEPDRADPSAVHFRRPPEALKPNEDFKRLIPEFKHWLHQNRDKGHGAFFRATQKGILSEDAHWEIRQMIAKTGKKGSSDPLEDQTLQYHMVLYLAREFEETRLEAEKLLNDLTHRKSPLEGALEEVPSVSFFEDTPLMETKLRVKASHLRQVYEAWFGLFGSSLSRDATFMTLDSQVLNYALDMFEPEDMIIAPSGASKETDESSVSKQARDTIRLPLLAQGDKALKDPIKKGLSGRTMILLED